MFDLSTYNEICKLVIKDLLKERNVCINSDKIDEMVKEILNITYSIGGRFREPLLREIAETFLFEKGGIEKYLEKQQVNPSRDQNLSKSN